MSLITKLNEAFPGIQSDVITEFLALTSLRFDSLTSRAIVSLEKPYGECHFLSEDGSAYGFAALQMMAGQSCSLHYHRMRREFIYVVSGVLTLCLGADTFMLKPSDTASTIPGLPHRVSNEETEPVVAVELIAPFLFDDKVRLEDRYGRLLGRVAHTQ